MSRSSAALPTTLKSVTSTKIGELKKRRNDFEATRRSILDQTEKAKTSIDKATSLLEGVSKLEGVFHPEQDLEDDDSISSWQAVGNNSKAKLMNRQLILQLAAKDAAFPEKLVEQYQQELVQDLELRKLRHEHAQLYSELVTEWLSAEEDQPQISTPDMAVAEGDASMSESSFEDVGRKEMHEQRAQWESLVFNEAKMDVDKINTYLKRIFSNSKAAARQLEYMQKQFKGMSKSLQANKELVIVSQLKKHIDGLIAMDLLSEDKVAILRSFQTNNEVLTEVADVLNMRFNSLETWSWTTTDGAMTLEMRKQLNGRYRVYVDEDILDALLTHIIGMVWAVHFRSSFGSFFRSHAWYKSSKIVPKADQQRREYFLGEKKVAATTVQTERRNTYQQDYFMSQLPEAISDGPRDYNGTDNDDEDEKSPRKSPVDTKHSLLHLLMTEALIAKHLRPQETRTVIRSDFEWFGPSLPHDTIFAVLRFFGISDFWIDFFKKFLEVRVRFVQDGKQGEVRVRRRGVPMSNILSDVFGEVIMFVMDLAVNHATRSYLYRLHDDFWLWGTEEVCKRGWYTMTEFASVMGLKFNKEKTGTVRFGPEGEDQSGSDSDTDDGGDSDSNDSNGLARKAAASITLPKGEVRWGFLRLDAKAAAFVIDQDTVDTHIKELQLQLSYCTSIFSYIQAYNAYFARFFGNNFGKPSYAFGRQHLDMMIETFTRVQKAMFKEGSVTDYLSRKVADKFGVDDIPEGFWYWPVQKGGMDLRNPLIPLVAMRESMKRSARYILKHSDDLDEQEYTVAKDAFEQSNTGSSSSGFHSEIAKSNPDGKFMSREEFFQYREERSTWLHSAYQRLLNVPTEASVHETAEIKSWLESSSTSSSQDKAGGIRKDFDDMQPYWKWILAIYGAELIAKYGSLQLVDAGQVPIGVVSVMKAGKVRWRG